MASVVLFLFFSSSFSLLLCVVFSVSRISTHTHSQWMYTLSMVCADSIHVRDSWKSANWRGSAEGDAVFIRCLWQGERGSYRFDLFLCRKSNRYWPSIERNDEQRQRWRRGHFNCARVCTRSICIYDRHRQWDVERLISFDINCAPLLSIQMETKMDGWVRERSPIISIQLSRSSGFVQVTLCPWNWIQTLHNCDFITETNDNSFDCWSHYSLMKIVKCLCMRQMERWKDGIE